MACSPPTPASSMTSGPPADQRRAGAMAEMTRVDYYDDPNAPQANSLVPGGSAIVVGQHGEILLQRRADNDRWALPGGTMDIGETLADAVIREVREETGLDVEPVRIVGVYSDPRHVFAYDLQRPAEECLTCQIGQIVGGQLTTSEE